MRVNECMGQSFFLCTACFIFYQSFESLSVFHFIDFLPLPVDLLPCIHQLHGTQVQAVWRRLVRCTLALLGQPRAHECVTEYAPLTQHQC